MHIIELLTRSTSEMYHADALIRGKCINQHNIRVHDSMWIRSSRHFFSLFNKKLLGVRITTCREQGGYRVSACGCFAVKSSWRSLPSETFRNDLLVLWLLSTCQRLENRNRDYKSNSILHYSMINKVHSTRYVISSNNAIDNRYVIVT